MKDRHGNDPDRGIIGAHLVPPPVTTPPPPPPVVVKKISHIITVNVIGTDDQGRTLVQCPARGCGEPAYVDDDGRVVCPSGEAINAFMTRMIKIVEAQCFDT